MRRVAFILSLVIVLHAVADDSSLKRSLAGYYGYSWSRTAADSITWWASLSGVAAGGSYAPFWIHTGRYGAVSERPFSGVLQAGVFKPETQTGRWMDYSAGAQVSISFDGRFSIYPQQAFVSARLFVFRITAGFRPDFYDFDTASPELTAGNFMFSSNARPMPRITVSTNGYIPFPFLFGYVHFKAGISHAWLIDNVYVKRALLHHKYIGARLGGELPVNVAYEFHHAAQWGGISPVYGDLGTSFSSFVHIFSARNGGNNANDKWNAEGNHVGSQQLSVIAKWDGWNITAYWQNFFEDAPIRPLWSSVNISDGLWGLSVRQTHWKYISAFLYEFLNTTDQSGLLHDIDGLVVGGYDSYFTNSIYRNGWNYYLRSLGTPFITSPLFDKSSTQTTNSRVRAHHWGVKGDIYGFQYRILASHAINYGNYDLRHPETNHIVKSTNTALLLEVGKTVEQAWGLRFSLAVAADFGSQFGNNGGVMLTISKQGKIFSW